MTFHEIARRTQKFTIDNSPMILTAIGVTGTVLTAYLTGRATIKAVHIVEEESGLRIADLTFDKRDLKAVWNVYIPPVLAGAATIAAVIGANQIGTRRTAALAAAFSLSEKAFGEYKDKVAEKIGERKRKSIQDELQQDRVDANPVSNREVIIAGSGDVLCYEHYTGRYFTSSMEDLKKAQNDLNYRINHDMYASLGDFYDLVGLPKTSESDEVGWTSDQLMELEISTTLADDGRPCLAIDYNAKPVRDYFRIR